VNLARSQYAKEATFDLTPMIDVVLLLIVFFCLTAQFNDTQRRPVDLPREAGDARVSVAPASMVIDLDVQGGMTVAGQPCDEAALADLLARQTRTSKPGAPAIEILIRADRHCRTAHLSEVGRILANAGVHHWKLATAGSS